MPYFRSYSLHFSFNTIFYCFMPHNRSNNLCVSFSTFFSFLTIIQVLECVFLIFHVFDCFWPYSRSYSVCVSFCNLLRFLSIIQVLHCVFLLSMFLTLSRHIPRPTLCVSHFPQYSFFSPYSRSYSVHFSFSPFLGVSCQFSLNSVHVSFSTFFSFLAIFQDIHFSYLIFNVIQFSCNIPGPTVCFSQFAHFSVFLTKFQDLQCSFLIFHFFQFSRHIPGSRVCISHFSRFWQFLTIF